MHIEQNINNFVFCLAYPFIEQGILDKANNLIYCFDELLHAENLISD